MRTALILLMLLALASIPGSLVPQDRVDPSAVRQWQQTHPTLTPIYERLELFHVYGSAWFSAIYLLLMVSLVGCILPRLRVYWRAAAAPSPRAPRNLARLPHSAAGTSIASPDIVAETARALLRRHRYRVLTEASDNGAVTVSAQRGYLREAGNLAFHLSLVVTWSPSRSANSSDSAGRSTWWRDRRSPIRASLTTTSPPAVFSVRTPFSSHDRQLRGRLHDLRPDARAALVVSGGRVIPAFARR